MRDKEFNPEKFIDRMNELLVQDPDYSPEFGLFKPSPSGARGHSIRGYDWKDKGFTSMGLHVKIAHKVWQEFGL